VKRLIAAIIAGVLGLALAPPASANNARHFLYPPGSSPHGKSLSQWLGAYQIWLNEIPTPENPLHDPASPLNCALQPGNVVFLGGAGADCTILEGAAIAFTPALAFWECSTGEGLGETFAELRQCARNNFARDLGPDVYHQRIWIDGHLLKHQRRWVTVSPGEIIDFPQDNIWGAAPGPSKSVTKGFMFVLRPLHEGRHRIRWVLHHDVFGDFNAVWKLRVDDDED
jgi:hypothetical protein